MNDAQDFFPVHIHSVFRGLLASRVAEEIWQRFHDEISSALFFFLSLSLSRYELSVSATTDNVSSFWRFLKRSRLFLRHQVKKRSDEEQEESCTSTCVSGRKTVRSLFQNLYIVICKTYNFALRTKFSLSLLSLFFYEAIHTSASSFVCVCAREGQRQRLKGTPWYTYWRHRQYPFGDWLLHFVVLLAELLVAEKLRVHALQGFLRVFLWLFDACFKVV